MWPGTPTMPTGHCPASGRLTLIYTNKLMGVEEKIELGKPIETQSRTFGLAKQVSNFENGELVSEVTIIKPDGNMDVPEGTQISNRISINSEKNQLTIKTTHKGVTLVKTLKKRKLTAEQEAAEEAADLKAMEEADTEEK